jgi:hypothetical protein
MKKILQISDRLLYIGTSTPPIENTVRHICRSTAFLLKNQFVCAFDNTKFEELCKKFIKTITFKIVATDDCMTWFNGIVTKMIVSIERNSKDILLWPSTQWTLINNYEQLEATWTLKSNYDYASLYHTADKIVEKSQTLFTLSNILYQ